MDVRGRGHYVLCNDNQGHNVHRSSTSSLSLHQVERSWITDAQTFVRLLRDDNVMSEIEYRMLRNWHDWLIPKSPKISGSVYLKADVDIVMERLKGRNRSEEKKMDVSFFSASTLGRLGAGEVEYESTNVVYDAYLKDPLPPHSPLFLSRFCVTLSRSRVTKTRHANRDTPEKSSMSRFA